MTETSNPTSGRNPTFIHSLVCFLGVLLFVFIGLIYLKTSLHSIMLFCILWAGFNAFFIGNSFQDIKFAMNLSLQKCLPVFTIFILIGVIIAAFIMSGTIPSLIYYGLTFITPKYFLPIGLLLCSVMSISTGTAWGTAGTMGIALLGIGSSLGFPMPMIAGMVVSGAFFGDKLSPASDTTILSALSTQTELYKHIRNMVYTLFPSYFVTLTLFFFIGLHSHQPNVNVVGHELNNIQQSLASVYNINLITLLPILCMIVFSLKKIPAELSMMSSIIIALVIALTIQKVPLHEFLDGLFEGPKQLHSDLVLLNHILKSGGIMSMMWSFSLTFLVLCLGGILQHFKFLHVLLLSLLEQIKRPGTLIMSTIFSCVISNMVMGEAYLSILLIGKSYGESYDKMALDRCMLSRSIEEGATFSTALIPWTTAGAFLSSTLGVQTTDYFFWSFLNWIEPIVAILFAYLGIAIIRKK